MLTTYLFLVRSKLSKNSLEKLVVVRMYSITIACVRKSKQE